MDALQEIVLPAAVFAMGFGAGAFYVWRASRRQRQHDAVKHRQFIDMMEHVTLTLDELAKTAPNADEIRSDKQR